jgi:hypothetical protein
MKKKTVNYKVREESVLLASGYLIGIKRTSGSVIDDTSARKGAEEEFSLTQVESALAYDGYIKHLNSIVRSTFDENEL